MMKIFKIYTILNCSYIPNVILPKLYRLPEYRHDGTEPRQSIKQCIYNHSFSLLIPDSVNNLNNVCSEKNHGLLIQCLFDIII